MKSIDLSKEKVITLGDLSVAVKEDTSELLVSENAVMTLLSALEFVEQHRISVAARRGQAAPGSITGSGPVHDLFHSPEAQAVKEEICNVGRKLWQRQYVDGNGGQHLVSHRPQRSYLHSHFIEQGGSAPAGSLQWSI